MAGLAMAGWSAGCGNVFAPKHKVTVDAICAAGVAKPAGQSFRLVGKKSVLSQGQVNIGVVSACVSAALAHAGMYEAPEKVPADILIEVSCGQDNATRADPSSRETFLELSARTNAARAMEHSREPEIWNVRVSIQGLNGRIESAMPLLAAVASSYSAMDTKIQTLIEVPQSNASIAAVREAALKTLDAKAASAAATTAATATTPPVPAATEAK
jgi:hypothetical protein